MPLSYAECARVIAGAHERASLIGIRATVAVVDEGGLLQALGRMDLAPPLSAQIAEAKAVGAALLLRDGASIGQVHKERPGFFQAIDRMVRLPLIPGPGSVLVRRSPGDAAVLGAVGVSGGKPEQDLDCAEAGLRALTG